MTKISITNQDVDDVLFNPTRYFSSPVEVVETTELELDQKIALLLNWEWDVKLEEVAEEENMISQTPDILQEIKLALIKLGVTADIQHTSAGKGGGL
jgi:hypothetical protein